MLANCCASKVKELLRLPKIVLDDVEKVNPVEVLVVVPVESAILLPDVGRPEMIVEEPPPPVPQSAAATPNLPLLSVFTHNVPLPPKPVTVRELETVRLVLVVVVASVPTVA